MLNIKLSFLTCQEEKGYLSESAENIKQMKWTRRVGTRSLNIVDLRVRMPKNLTYLQKNPN